MLGLPVLKATLAPAVVVFLYYVRDLFYSHPPAADISGARFPRNLARAEQLVSFVAERIVFESDSSARCVC